MVLRMASFYARRFRRLRSLRRRAELLGLREVLDAAQAEGLQELLGGAVKDGPAQRIVAAGDADEALFHEEPQRLGAVDAADRLDLGAHDRLPVGDDGQRLARRRGE